MFWWRVRRNQEAYEVLVNALERGAELGECVRVIETELAKRELPGDVRRANREVTHDVRTAHYLVLFLCMHSSMYV